MRKRSEKVATATTSVLCKSELSATMFYLCKIKSATMMLLSYKKTAVTTDLTFAFAL
ncbi:hypothetical protein [Lysinibacillus sp. NPDC096259]|uniref:hypothetical protein n=1 Tax=Lysinibacillus sp. NPDC096259 TaxID=3390583 RepID=UPI003CFEBD33